MTTYSWRANMTTYTWRRAARPGGSAHLRELDRVAVGHMLDERGRGLDGQRRHHAERNVERAGVGVGVGAEEESDGFVREQNLQAGCNVAHHVAT